MSRRPELRMTWSKRERDYVYHYDRAPQDGHLLHCLFQLGADFTVRKEGERRDRMPAIGETVRRLRDELERRGYDPNTLTISVRRKRSPGVTPASQTTATEAHSTDTVDTRSDAAEPGFPRESEK